MHALLCLLEHEDLTAILEFCSLSDQSCSITFLEPISRGRPRIANFEQFENHSEH